MADARRKSARIHSGDQLRILTSPVAINLLQALRTGGSATVTELGQRLGREPNSLHYHMRKLKDTGFIREVATRRSGARTQSVYDVTADFFVYDNAPRNPQLRKHVKDIVAAMLRLAQRNFDSACQRPDVAREGGAERNLIADRYMARLTRSELAEVNRHLRAVENIFVSSDRTRGGELCELTVLLTPSPPCSD